MLYQLVKPFFFSQDPEHIHEQVMKGLIAVSKVPALQTALEPFTVFEDPRLKIERFGLKFPNPIGLAAGFDKNALAVRAWPALGFGFLEVGTITALAQPGNEKPRLFRLPEDLALINRMGFNNDGADVVAARLQGLNLAQQPLKIPLGINVGKSKVTELEEAPEDYRTSMTKLSPFADYFVVNVSSPNTPGLRQLQDKDKLAELLAVATDPAVCTGKPVLLKIAPDLTDTQIDEVIELTRSFPLAGLILTNTTISREGLTNDPQQTGGLSGKPLTARSFEVLKYVRSAVGKTLPLVSVGGIFTADEAYWRLRAGASLLQVYTSFIYEGPQLAANLNRGILERLKADGFVRLEDAIGVDA
ncbi:quinone-dependent dihydroorotate dehydrogenase [Deinococcus cellulosilyticus]|uniref:Dihydroorotate dehydrogenase (quinone) n=1 Tax=Deinococcus cellulosilyticus (strain DSM 18568 / NBRC 106333 / KACC 11606 / 5516J-15) TaxID=1223518 RepID=A0A511N7N9_DEIC1|nr:quinone-dependent dihydroorotate dehydrogenase [Deinococcus cellulosilyticus]GEM48431.1 dihydroorotate dehydrogenase (quinone) [Deinococcus cellulosilyticus NBRC 106333 = KACC 11606]